MGIRGPIVVVSLAAFACGSGSHTGRDAGVDAAADAAPPDAALPDAADCRDDDLDGYLSCGGQDCDDHDAAVHTLAECAGRCDSDPHAPTCPCEDDDEPELCYTGPVGSAGVGICAAGIHRCRDGIWSACEGETLPQFEYCNQEDDDCDALVDEEVQSGCGDCNDFCEHRCVGVSCEETFLESDARDLALDGASCLALPAGIVEGTYVHVWFLDDFGSWSEVSYEADLPGDATLDFEMRSGSTLDELGAADWILLGSGNSGSALFPLECCLEGPSFLAVRVTLHAPNGEAARLCRLAAEHEGVILI